MNRGKFVKATAIFLAVLMLLSTVTVLLRIFLF